MQQRPEFDVFSISPSRPSLDPPESGDAETTAGFPFRRLATEEGVFISITSGSLGRYSSLSEAVLADPPCVTEVAFAPALAAEEIRAPTCPQQAASTTSPS